MPNVKKIIANWNETEETVYCIIRREADDFRLDDSDGSFTTSPADPYLALTEDAVIKGRYEVEESRTEWDDGRYTVAAYKQDGGAPVPTDDTMIASGEIFISDDEEITPEDYSTLTLSQIRGAVASGTFDNAVTVIADATLRIARGDVKTLSLVASTDWDFTGKKIYFAMKVKNEDGTFGAEIVNREASNDGAQAASIVLTTTETATIGDYVIEWEQRNSDESNPMTVQQSEIEIFQDVRISA